MRYAEQPDLVELGDRKVKDKVQKNAHSFENAVEKIGKLF